ncbi:hypothetical protein OG689_41675 [Kitasatospora sp. NBC_00240]|uniref:hypothetical protein n=1 Tax=Kitasatospora sp. NBC_00240 TaxID=2903567 RepID=UPI0022535AF0|nr:hypothetical protein [Kitasatospora sp. NBC_00240]MCX5215668.1 hypothetical protein [Kitasatospora sp. NBC_00240]
MEEIVAQPEKALARLVSACRRRRRTLVTGVAVTLVGAVVAGVMFWAPVERANLLVQLLSPILAAVIAGALTEYWKRSRGSR